MIDRNLLCFGIYLVYLLILKTVNVRTLGREEKMRRNAVKRIPNLKRTIRSSEYTHPPPASRNHDGIPESQQPVSTPNHITEPRLQVITTPTDDPPPNIISAPSTGEPSKVITTTGDPPPNDSSSSTETPSQPLTNVSPTDTPTNHSMIATTSSSLTTLTTRQKRRGTSQLATIKQIILKFFTQQDEGFLCKLCQERVRSTMVDHSNSNLTKHIENTTHPFFPKQEWNKLREDIVRMGMKSKEAEMRIDRLLELHQISKASAGKQSRIQRYFQKAPITPLTPFDWIMNDTEFYCHRMLGIVLRNQTFASLEDGFTASTSQFGLPTLGGYRIAPPQLSRTTMVEKYLEILRQAAVSQTRLTLGESAYGSTMSDGWSSRPGVKTQRFTSIHYQFVDWTGGRIQRRLLDFNQHQSAHSGYNLSTSYLKSINALHSGILLANHVSDNASNELKAATSVLQDLGFWKKPHACLAHTIQLDVNEFLDLPQIQRILLPILKINSRLLNSPSLAQGFIEHQELFKLNPLAPVSVVKTRWWSVLPVLKFYLERSTQLVDFADVSLPGILHQLTTKSNWAPGLSLPRLLEVQQLSDFLNSIKKAQDTLSSDSKVTSSRVIHQVDIITHLPCLIATPRFIRLRTLLDTPVSLWTKAAFFCRKGRMILHNLGQLDSVRTAIKVDLGLIHARINPVVTSINSLIDPFGSIGHFAIVDAALGLIETWLDDPTNNCKAPILQMYGETILPSLTVQSPAAAKTFRGLLGLLFSSPATQVACERTFSKATKTFDPSRASLSPSTLQALVFVQETFPNTNEGIESAMNAVRFLHHSAHLSSSSSSQLSPHIGELQSSLS